MEVDLDASIEQTLQQSHQALTASKWGEAALKSAEVIALVSAARRVNNNAQLFELHVTDAKLVLGVSETFCRNFEAAADCFLSLHIREDAVLEGWSGEELALLAVVAIIGSPKVSRAHLTRTLLDSVQSCLGDFFDNEDPFPTLLRLGKLISQCDFGQAIRVLRNLFEATGPRLKLPLSITNATISNFINVCITESASCYQKIPLAVLASDLALSEDDLIERLSSIIVSSDSKLRSHRIDLEERCLVERTETLASHTVLNQLRESYFHLELLDFRKLLLDAEIRVE